MNSTVEVNFDGLIGPTHNYSGLSFGNMASMEHGKLVSNPKKAALQGLEKMKTLMDLGMKQAILPPHERPFIPLFRTFGFEGSDEAILAAVAKQTPEILLAGSSAACMWTANAATVSPSADSLDKRTHVTPANLITKFHRSYESPTTGHILRKIFPNPTLFNHHFPLPPHTDYGDEGAANHTRLCAGYGEPGIQLFVYGRKSNGPLPKKFPARQTEEASKALARLHRIPEEQLVFAQQNPDAIDAGVFHNDVASVGNQNVFFYHEKAFLNTAETVKQLQDKFTKICNGDLFLIPVTEQQVSLQEAVRTYLFNSQIISRPDNTMVLVAPHECRESQITGPFIDEMLKLPGNPIKKVIYQDVRQSMQNGGGPACLRLRIVLNEKELAGTFPGVFLTPQLYERLKQWIEKFYRDKLSPEELADPTLLSESRRALDDLTAILNLGPVYPFQLQRLR